MPITVIINPNKSLEYQIKGFTKKIMADGVLKEFRNKSSYTKPSVAKKSKSIAARNQLKKNQRRNK